MSHFRRNTCRICIDFCTMNDMIKVTTVEPFRAVVDRRQDRWQNCFWELILEQVHVK